MKKCFIISILVLITVSVFAQKASEEAMDKLDAAKGFIQKGEYAQAQKELDLAQEKLGELLAEGLLRFIPEKPTGFNFIKKEANTLGKDGAIIGSANASTAVGYYSKGNANYELSITKGGLIGQTGGFVSGLATMFGGMGGMRQVRIKGYCGTLDYDAEDLSGSLSIAVGNKISVLISGYNAKSPDHFTELAEQLDLEALEKCD